MAGESGIWEALNDKCWSILEIVKLDGLFDRYNIPPILFPLAIVALILVVLLMLSPAAPQQPSPCGDTICDDTIGETRETCPTDCVEKPTGKRIVVSLDKRPDCQVTVQLKDSNNNPLVQDMGAKSEFVFSGVEAASVYAIVTDRYGNSQPSEKISTQTASQIPILLRPEICKSTTQTTTTGQRGVLTVIIKDATTKLPLSNVTITIADIVNGKVGSYEVPSTVVNNQADFTLAVGKSYRISATKIGYRDYLSSSLVSVFSDRRTTETIEMTPASTTSVTGEPAVQKGSLEVCISNGTRPISGTINLRDLSGNTVAYGDVSKTGEGCYIFTGLNDGSILTASLSGLPADCVPKTSPEITIRGGGTLKLPLDVECGRNTGFLKVRVKAGDRVLTRNATITVWKLNGDLIPGGGIADSLSMGDGGYTEEIIVPANEQIYVWVRGLPLGYLDYKSRNITVSPREHRKLDISLNATPSVPPTSSEFAFSGVTMPLVVAPNAPFPVTISEIRFGSTILTGEIANVAVNVSGNNCSVSYVNNWRADCIAPSAVGRYNVTIQATYNRLKGMHSETLKVRLYSQGYITVRSLYSVSKDPPLELSYEILLNGSILKSLASQNLTLTYRDSPGAYPGELTELKYEPNLGHWVLTADVPYKGDYEIRMYLEAIDENENFYNTTYIATFTSKSNSPKLVATAYLSDKVLAPEEQFTLEAILKFGNNPAYGLGILDLSMDEISYRMSSSAERVYRVQLSAPNREICSLPLKFMIKGEEIKNRQEVFVIDTTQTKSLRCPLDSSSGTCNGLGDVRKCVKNYKDKTSYYAEDKLIACIKTGCPPEILFECPSTEKGDLLYDCQLDESDVYKFEEILNSVDQGDWNRYASCMDIDNDGDVDADDKACLSNIVSRKWYGDIGSGQMANGVCAEHMMGGFCFKINTNTVLPGDLVEDGNIDNQDVDTMRKIIQAASAGVTVQQPILDIADFNQDGSINSIDLDCIGHMRILDFRAHDIRLPSAEEIPVECFKVFHLYCPVPKTRGDLNRDIRIDEKDRLIIKLMAERMMPVTSDLRPCADINEDNVVDRQDVICINALLSGEMKTWYRCLKCGNETMPIDAYNPTLEICDDGYDNDCDNLWDLTPGHADNRCKCIPETPCEMKKDIDKGMPPGVKDGKYTICGNYTDIRGYFSRNKPKGVEEPITGTPIGEAEQRIGVYRWTKRNDTQCNRSTQCNIWECGGRTFRCSRGKSGAKWYELTPVYASGEKCLSYESDCTGLTKTVERLPNEICDDGWDNDCVGGDEDCPWYTKTWAKALIGATVTVAVLA